MKTSAITKFFNAVGRSEGWQALLDRYILIEMMTHQQLFYWDGEHMRQSAGTGFLGQKLLSFFN